MFIETIDGTFIPLSAVILAESRKCPDYGDAYRIRLQTENGVYWTRFTDEEFKSFAGVHIKADPGWEMLAGYVYYDGDLEFGYWRQPIIAWLINGPEEPSPVTLNPPSDGNYVVLSPSGSVHAASTDGEYGSLEAWEEASKERWSRAKQRQEAFPT